MSGLAMISSLCITGVLHIAGVCPLCMILQNCLSFRAPSHMIVMSHS